VDARRIIRWTLPGLIVAAAAAPAQALCAAPPPMRVALRNAPVAFVGTVVETTNDDRWATVEVTEVWEGHADARVEVRGGPADPAGPMQVSSSVERTYEEGTTYLFVPDSGTGDVFTESSCSPTRELNDRLERLRPEGAGVPLDDLRTGIADDGGFPLWGVAVAVAVVAAAFLVVRRLRSA
jgi:hypothetical protein